MLPNPTANPRQDRRNSTGLPHSPRSTSPLDDSTSSGRSAELEEVEAVVSVAFPSPSSYKKKRPLSVQTQTIISVYDCVIQWSRGERFFD